MGKYDEWIKVGNIDVDAGLCWLGDPCYIIGAKDLDYPYLAWDDFCKELFKHDEDGVCKWKHDKGSFGKGVSVQTGYGDGTYPVYIKKNKEGIIVEVKVVFDDDDDYE